MKLRYKLLLFEWFFIAFFCLYMETVIYLKREQKRNEYQLKVQEWEFKLEKELGWLPIKHLVKI